MSTYFAYDGSYGDGNALLILDTHAFTDEDWEAIDAASDTERVSVAIDIHYKHEVESFHEEETDTEAR
jgi:hypothetical protein